MAPSRSRGRGPPPRKRQRAKSAAPVTHEVSESSESGSDQGDDGQANFSQSAYQSLLQSLQSDRTKKERKAKRRKHLAQDLKDHDSDFYRSSLEKSNGELEAKHAFFETDSEGVDGAFHAKPDRKDSEVDEPISSDSESDAENSIDGKIARLEDEKIDENEEIAIKDSFDSHFGATGLAKKIEAIQKSHWVTRGTITKSTRTIISVANSNDNIDDNANTNTTDSDPTVFISPALSSSSLSIKQRLRESLEVSGPIEFDDEEQTFAGLLFRYRDMLYCKRTHTNAPKLRRLLCLHALNHCIKSRDRVLKNTEKQRKAGDNENWDANLHDQGFTRPKVLILLPTRESCGRFVKTMIGLLGRTEVENRNRFEDHFIDRDSKFPGEKPADFRELFDGNDDDNFRIGIKLGRQKLKLYSEFYGSDMIVASPLGLRLAIAGDEKKDKPADYQFLSSIEIAIMDHADALLMQNWEHVEYVFEHLNLLPNDLHDFEFTRVRPWYFERHAPYYRQTVVLSKFNTPNLRQLQREHSLNWEGRVTIQHQYTGEIQRVGISGARFRQSFTRFDARTHVDELDARFKYFTNAIIPMFSNKRKHTEDLTGTLLFVPNYVDFLRVRNYFRYSPAAPQIDIGIISEYSDVREISRAMSHFKSGRHKILLYTERAHHFRRHVIRGVKRIIMYALPDNPIFYREILGYLSKSLADGTLDKNCIDGEHAVVRISFSKYDVDRLERTVGTSRVKRMVADQADIFDFV